MKKLLTIIVILVAVFLFKTQIKDITEDLINYVQINILKNNISDDLNNSSDYFDDSSIENQNNGNNIDNSDGLDNNYSGVSSYKNYETIKLGESLNNIISKMGQPNNIERSEYDFDWYVYNEDKTKLCMVGILNNKVVALFSNTMDSCESDNIKLGDNESKVLNKYTPLKYRLKGNIKYIINEDYYSLIKGNSSYITVFYDSFEGNKVAGIQIISKEVENNMSDIYATDTSITHNFENINRYLVNSERASRGLNTLSYDENTTLCARAHSKDMRDNDYFAHDNLKNQTPFDRMKQYKINYRGAAENIAAGQTSAIFAHYALMNSKGHRVNILGNYKYIGVGVVFGGSTNMYLTQNFYI